MHTASMSTLAVVLAAGGGSRFAGPGHKLLAELDGRPILQTVLEVAVESGIGPVLVVTGAVDIDAVLERSRDAGHDVSVAHNPDWATGQASSLQLAVRNADRHGCDSIVVGLGDQPFVTPEAWRAVAATDAPIAVAEYDGDRRNPVKLYRSVWPDLPTTGDEGARALFRLKPHLVQPVPCQGSAADIDTWEDLQSWQNRSSTNSP